MYIKELQIDGFGALAGLSCAFEAPVTVVYGPNEAGKSTLLRFIRSVLYGFANRGQPEERGEPVFGGRHGGRLVLRSDGQELVLERYADVAVRRGGAAAVLRDANGAEFPLSQAELERRLLGGVSERLFRQLFAVTLDDLQQLRTIAGDEVGNYLYHAGMAGGAALTAANKALEAEMEKLFKPKGALPELNRVMAEIRELEEQLRRGRQGEGAFNEAALELEAVEREASEAEARLPELRRRLALAQSAVEARESWLRLQAIRLEEAELASKLPDPLAEPLPEDASARWEALLGERRQAEARLRQAEAELDRLRRERESLRWDEALAARLPDIEELEAQREAAAARREELAEVAADIRLQDETLASLVARLSPSWEAADLQRFASLSERERARAMQAGLAEAERELERLEAELRRIERQKAALVRERLAAGEEGAQAGGGRPAESDAAAGGLSPFGAFAPRERGALLQAWSRVEDELRQWERAWAEVRVAESAVEAAGRSAEGSAAAGPTPLGRRGEVPARRKKPGRPGPHPLAPAALFAAALAAALLPAALRLDGAAASGLYALAGALLMFAGTLWRNGWRHSASQSASSAGEADTGAAGRSAAQERARAALAASERSVNDAVRRLLARPEEAAAALLREEGGSPGAEREEAEAARRALREAVYRELERLDAEERDRAARQDDARRLAELTREREQLEREREAGAARLEAKRRAWEEWLAERKLPAGLPPELLPELFQLAEQALQTLRQRGRLVERAEQLRPVLAAFEAAAAELFAACPPPAAAGGDAALAVKLLLRDAQQQSETAAEARRLDERLRQAEAAAAEARAAYAEAAAAVQAPPAAAGDADEAAYERRLRVDERRRALRRERREAELRLAAGRDASSLAELEALLERHDEAALAQLLARAEADLREEERRRAELLDRRGRLTEQLERLRREAETEDRLVALGERSAEFERLADRYAVLALTAELIRKTKAVFEEDRQPEVLRKASAYFAEMTGGAYARIVVPGDAETLRAETGDRRSIDVSMLSRGTREQLYLALRFALAGAPAAGQALPLLLDDLFVHFDGERLGRTARVLGDVSEDRQIVLFTCHEHVAETIAAALPDAGLVRLARRGASGAASGLFPSEAATRG